MKACVLLVMIISGCCFLSPSWSKTFVLIKNAASWHDAQSHCRERYIDLASVTDMKELKLLNQLDQSQPLWLGLYGDTRDEVEWKWSVEDKDSGVSDMVDTGYRNWGANEPNGDLNYNRFCTVLVRDTGKWDDRPCNWGNPVLCYSGDPSNVIFNPDETTTWDEGRAYCRRLHTDLAIVNDQDTNELMRQQVPQYKSPWIGLYRESWKWSDGINVTLTNWASGQPSGDGSALCVMSHNGEWINGDCNTPSRYACYGDLLEQKVVKLVVRVSEPSMDMMQLQEGVLKELRERMANLKIDGKVTIRWKKQPDGTVFHKKTNNDAKEEEETLCPKP